MVTQTTTLTLPHAPDLAQAEFEFERSRNEAVRSANRQFIRERFPDHWTVVYEGGQLAAFEDPQEFLAFLRGLTPFASEAASARPPWPPSADYATPKQTSDLTESELDERKRNRTFWNAHGKQLAAAYPHNWIVVYGGGKVGLPADQRELWVFRDGCDPTTWMVSLRSSPRKPIQRWKAQIADRTSPQ